MRPPEAVGEYGYSVYLPTAVRESFPNHHPGALQEILFSNLPAFSAAAWNMARRGLLRPSVLVSGPGNDDGLGFSLTSAGVAWLAAGAADSMLNADPSQLGVMLAALKGRFGEGFHERAQEAVGNYQANRYLSCCVMCGAAAESVLLAAAIS